MDTQGEALVKAWLDAQVAEAEARRALDGVVNQRAAAAELLALYLMPADAQAGEKFAVVHDDTLVQVTVDPNGRGVNRIEIRPRGKKFDVVSAPEAERA